MTWNWSSSDRTNAPFHGTGISSTFNHSFQAPGAYKVVCVVTDAFGATGSGNFSVAVSSWPVVGLSLVVWPFGSVLQGNTLQVRAETTWGYGPFNFTWTRLPRGCTSPGRSDYRLLCTPDEAGSYNISVTVTDSTTGATALAYALVVVEPTFLGMPEPGGFGVVAAIALLALASEAITRLLLPVSVTQGSRRFDQTWFVSLTGGIVGLASLALPWLFLSRPGSGDTMITGGFVPYQVFLGKPSASLPSSMMGGYPFLPNSFWYVLGPAVVGFAIFGAGCLMALFRRLAASLLMLGGLVVVWFSGLSMQFGWGVSVGWAIGLVAMLVVVAAYALRPLRLNIRRSP
jgi:hypothetical protein